jgi:hypothetical protein
MSLLNVILGKEHIGGLEISDSGLRFFSLRENKTEVEIFTFAEEKISLSKTKDETTKETSFFSKEIADFIKKHRIKYAVVSLPNDEVFTKTYVFPAILPEEKLPDSVNMIIDFQLPLKKADIYYDWERTDDGKNKRALLSYTPKVLINNLIAKTKNTGLKIVAIESHALSLARIIKQTKDVTLLIIERGEKKTSFSTIKNNKLLFSQTFFNEELKNDLNKTTEKIIKYHDWLSEIIQEAVLIGDFSASEIKNLPLKVISPEIPKNIKSGRRLENSQLIALGAALRGLSSRKEDTMISLMETGTEEAFAQAKAKSVFGILFSASIALAIFFIGALTAVWLIIGKIQNNFNNQIITEKTVGMTSEATMETQAQSFNGLISQANILLTPEIGWYDIISEIKNRLTPGIKINSLALPGRAMALSISGTAGSREEINALKQSFASSPLFQNVDVPLTNLGKKTEIPFSLSFQIKPYEKK